MNLRIREWSTNRLQGGTWMLVGLLVLLWAFYEPDYRYVWLVLGVAMVVYGFKLFRKVETPFERRQREIRRMRL
jgi:hypothetical protein